jgi:hypothetical protein
MKPGSHNTVSSDIPTSSLFFFTFVSIGVEQKIFFAYLPQDATVILEGVSGQT